MKFSGKKLLDTGKSKNKNKSSKDSSSSSSASVSSPNLPTIPSSLDHQKNENQSKNFEKELDQLTDVSSTALKVDHVEIYAMIHQAIQPLVRRISHLENYVQDLSLSNQSQFTSIFKTLHLQHIHQISESYNTNCINSSTQIVILHPTFKQNNQSNSPVNIKGGANVSSYDHVHASRGDSSLSIFLNGFYHPVVYDINIQEMMEQSSSLENLKSDLSFYLIHGTEEYSDGSSYVGQLSNKGNRHGFGVYKYKTEGSKYNTYVGEWLNGYRHGVGKYTHNNGFCVGFWVNDMKEGKGTSFYSNKSVYTGNYFKGNKHGFGIYTYSDGSQYEGNWVFGNRSGQGILRNRDGTYYEGEWKNNVFHGTGKLVTDYFEYEGEYQKGYRHGKGKMIWKKKSKFITPSSITTDKYDWVQYDGFWKYDEMHGDGTVAFKNGEVISSEFHRFECADIEDFESMRQQTQLRLVSKQNELRAIQSDPSLSSFFKKMNKNKEISRLTFIDIITDDLLFNILPFLSFDQLNSCCSLVSKQWLYTSRYYLQEFINVKKLNFSIVPHDQLHIGEKLTNRRGHSTNYLVSNNNKKYVLIFGGYGNTGHGKQTHLNDLLLFEFETQRIIQHFPVSHNTSISESESRCPNGRSGHAMVPIPEKYYKNFNLNKADVEEPSTNIYKFLLIGGGAYDNQKKQKVYWKVPYLLTVDLDNMTMDWNNLKNCFAGDPYFIPYKNIQVTVSEEQGKLYCVGGVSTQEENTPKNQTISSLNLNSLEWTIEKPSNNDINDIPSHRIGHTAVASEDGKMIYMFGGENKTYFNDLYSFDTTCSKWEKIQGKGDISPLPVSYHSSSIVGGNMYVFGGRFNGIVYNNRLFSFNTKINEWKYYGGNESGKYSKSENQLKNSFRLPKKELTNCDILTERYSHSMINIPGKGMLVSFGSGLTCDRSHTRFPGDLLLLKKFMQNGIVGESNSSLDKIVKKYQKVFNK